MTVGELRQLLLKFPQDAEVAYRACSDSNLLFEDDLNLIKAEDKKVIRHPNNPEQVCDFKPWSAYSGHGGLKDPKFVTVVMLPGN